MKLKCIDLIGDMAGCVTIGKVYENIPPTTTYEKEVSNKYVFIKNDFGAQWWCPHNAFVEIKGDELEIIW